MRGLTTSCPWLRCWVGRVIDHRLMATIIIHQGHHHPHHHQQQRQHQQQYEDPTAYENPSTVYRTHNIFDVSASSASSTASSAFPTHFSSFATTTNGGGGAGSQPSSVHKTYQQHPFDSSLPAINSTLGLLPLNSPLLPPQTHHHHRSIPPTPT